MAVPEKTSSQHFSLHWDKCQANLLSSFEKLLNSEQFVDVTLAVESQTIKCHKVVLSASSAYFEKILLENPCSHPVVIMRGMEYWEVMALVKFMYRGEVSVEEENIETLLKTAEALQIRGLVTDVSTDSSIGSDRSDDSVDIKDISGNGQENANNEPIQNEQLNNMRRKTTSSESEYRSSSPNINSQFKKAFYRNSLPSFKNSITDFNTGVMRDTPLVPLLPLMPHIKPDENMMIKEEMDLEYHRNPLGTSVNPSVEYAVLEGEEVNLGPLSQIMASNPGPSSSLELQNKGPTGNITEPPFPFPEHPVARFNHWPVKLKTRKRCAYCKQAFLKRKDVATGCTDCKVGLCLGICFQKYHEIVGACGTIFVA